LGRVVDDKLKSEYSEFVTIDGIVKRLSAEFQAEKQRLEAEIELLDTNTANAREIVAQFESFDQAEQLAAALQEQANELVREDNTIRKETTRNTIRANELIAELSVRRTALFKFFRRSEAKIQADIQRNVIEAAAIATRQENFGSRMLRLTQQLERAKHDRDARRAVTFGKDRARAETIVTTAENERNRSVAVLRDVEAKILAIRDSILRNARIIGATCTKAYLSPKDLGHADLVIIDEASMVPLPVAWFSAGLARERVVISGDFRQLPPIIPTQEEEIFEALGHDTFRAAGLTDPDDPRLMMLDTQYRMRAEICQLIAGPMYSNRLQTAADRHTAPGRVPMVPFDGPLTIIDTSDLWPFESQTAFYSRFNMLHALLARNIAWHLRKCGVIENNLDLGISTPYAAQARMIQKLLEGEGLDEFVRAGTVHRYQGDERRIMLLEIPESHG
jgi:hypothetical protein